VKRSATKPPSSLARALRELLLAPLHLYRRLISPAIPDRCKYYPTCSTYAVQAVRELGLLRGAVVAAWRLARCNPWSHGGVDELADRRLFRDHGSHGDVHGHGGSGIAA
jgi:putative membrane protein insertion efficiency factor